MRHSLPRHVPLLVLLLVLTTLSAPAQARKTSRANGRRQGQNQNPQGQAQGHPQDPPKVEEPKSVAPTSGCGATFSRTAKTSAASTSSSSKVADADLANLATLKDLHSIDLSGDRRHRRRPGRDQGAEQPADARPRGTKVTDAGLATLRAHQLEYLNLSETQVGGNLAPLGKLTKLKTLSLAQTTVNDNSLTATWRLDLPGLP